MLTVGMTALLVTSIASDEPIVAHGVEWYRKSVLGPLEGLVPWRTWSGRSVTSYLTLEGGDAIRGDNSRTTYY
jgi:hypothetical protein